MNSSIENSFQQAKLLWEAGRIEEAVSKLIKILRQDSTHLQAWFLLGMALEEPEKKAHAFKQVLAQAPNHQGAKKQIELLGKIPARQPTYTQENPLVPIAALIKDGNHKQAVHSLKKILKTKPNNEQAWYLLGLALDDPSKKVYAFKQVLQIDPLHKKAGQQLKKLTKQHGINIIPKKPTLSTLQIRSKFTSSTFYRLSTYLVSRALTIFITIFVGVFLTVVITNKSGQIEENVSRQIVFQVRYEYPGTNFYGEGEEIIQNEILIRSEEAGLNLSFFPRHFRWTLHALGLDPQEYSKETKNQIFKVLPNTLLIIGSANLIIFLTGIPLALFLSRKHGSIIDRLVAFLAPVSSIPAWVIGILLMYLFALELKILPFGGMYGTTVEEIKQNQILVVGKHMILPVLSVILAQIFQLVYTWRTYFLIYAEENYVDLGKAKGLPPKILNKKYILRPALPFIITSFSLTLITFWQTTTALEVVFRWPGLGRLYIYSLPHFYGERMFPGNLIVALGIVVIFAYLLGFTVLILDLVYAIVDPQIRLGKQRASVTRKIKRVKRRGKRKFDRSFQPQLVLSPIGIDYDKRIVPSLKQKLIKRIQAIISFFRQFLKYPSAAVGLIIIFGLLIGSAYAFIALPYSEIGEEWFGSTFDTQINAPKLAKPSWVNLFRKDDLPPTIILSSQDDLSVKTIDKVSENKYKVSIDFSFDYNYSQIPTELKIFFKPKFVEKRPFVSMYWITPDGREIKLKDSSVQSANYYQITNYIPRGRGNTIKISEDILISNDPINKIPDFFFLFKDLTSDGSEIQTGAYSLKIEALMFEEGADLDVELVMLGQVYGAAGTDFMRRDLLVPLVWGMPFALLIGLLGATITIILAMIFAAAGVWFGGWVDALIQRITEANMILPVLALGVLMYAFFNVDLWTILLVIILLNVFSSPTKSFRAAFLQIRNAPYIEAAQAYGATNTRIIFKYMIPRIIPILIPQLVTLVPSYVFLEATLHMFNIKANVPTWGRIIYEAVNHGIIFGDRYWVLQPIVLLLLTGFAFAMVGFTLDKILNPRLKNL